MDDLTRLTVPELLALHGGIGEELRTRGVLRSANNPTGDLAEFLFCKAFGWEQAPNSERGFDAKSPDGTRYQIKGRRMHRPNTSRQLSALRNLPDDHFDFLAAVLFDEVYRVFRAALIPKGVILSGARYHKHTNSHIFMLRDALWSEPGVQDVTDQLRAVAF